MEMSYILPAQSRSHFFRILDYIPSNQHHLVIAEVLLQPTA